MPKHLAVSILLSFGLCSCFDFKIDPLDVDQLVTQKEESDSGDLYYSFHESYITSISPHYLVRVPSAGGDPDTLYTSDVYFDFTLVGDSVSVLTCSRESGRGVVGVLEDEDFDCRTNQPLIGRFKRGS